MSNKRPLPAGSPPPSGPSKHKKAKPSIATAPGLSRVNSIQASTPLGSSPPYYADSPRARSRSRSRSRSVSIAPAGKGKERERDETAPPGDGADEVDVDADGEEEAIDYSEDEFGMNQKENARQKEDLRVLLDHFDPSQMDRYESYRRSGLAKSSVRRLVNQVLQQSVSPSILTVVRGFSKVFVGEIVEKARQVSTKDGPLAPEDLREAYRIYMAEHDGSIGPPTKKMFVK